MFACNSAHFGSTRYENRGSELHVRAQLAVGGPWVPGMVDTPSLFREANGGGQAFGLGPSEFGAVEREILSTGAMTLTIREVVMPPDSRVVTADRYPTLRMIEKGGLRWGLLKAGSDPTASPEVIFRESQFRWIGCDPSLTDESSLQHRQGASAIR